MNFSNIDNIEVSYVRHCGDDVAVLDSTFKEFKGQSFKQKVGFLEECLKDKYTSVFETIDLTMLVKCPIYVARHVQRFRTFSYNEISIKTGMCDEMFYVKNFGRAKSAKEKRDLMEYITYRQFESFDKLLKLGVSEEDARMVLGQNMMTKFYMKGNLWNWCKFLLKSVNSELRDEHIKLAVDVYKLLFQTFPMCITAFNNVLFSEKQLKMVGVKK